MSRTTVGQPSYALTCLLVCTVTQYLEAPIQFGKPTTIEEMCKVVCLTHMFPYSCIVNLFYYFIKIG